MIEGLAHPKIFDRSKKSSIIVTGVELVNDYLRILLLSARGSLLADPRYGCTLKSLVFNPNDQILIGLVKDSIVEAIRIYAKSIIVNYSDINITQDNEKIFITINYKMNNKVTPSETLSLEILNTEVING